jgi:hypothetical protein
MLYANYQRNSASANAIWSLWDAVSIENTELVGYWDLNPVAALSWPPPTPAAVVEPRSTVALAAVLELSDEQRTANATCLAGWKETVGKFIAGSGGAADDIGFGTSCGPPRPFDYPALPLDQIKQKCCDLGDGCVAFSYAADQDPAKPGVACARKNWGNGGYEKDGGKFNGYEKLGPRPPTPPPAPSPPPPPPHGTCPPDSILATVYVECVYPHTLGFACSIYWEALSCSTIAARLNRRPLNTRKMVPTSSVAPTLLQWQIWRNRSRELAFELAQSPNRTLCVCRTSAAVHLELVIGARIARGGCAAPARPPRVLSVSFLYPRQRRDAVGTRAINGQNRKRRPPFSQTSDSTTLP